MKKVLIAYFSATGVTARMAEYIAEGVRFSGQQTVVKKMADIKAPAEAAGYDGYIIGSPTYSQDAPGPVKRFLDMVGKKALEGKMGGAFGSYRHDVGYQHDTYAPVLIYETLQNEYKMKPFELGGFALKEDVAGTGEGLKACQDYGRVFGKNLGE
jgi:flavodoxin